MNSRNSLLGVVLIPILLIAGLLYTNFSTSTEVWLQVDDHAPIKMNTHFYTVGEFLQEHGIQLGEGDLVIPTEATAITPGMHVKIVRACPVVVKADGESTSLRMRRATVAEALNKAGVLVKKEDEILVEGGRASLDSPLPACKEVRPKISGWPVPPWQRTLSPIHVEVRRAYPVVLHEGELSRTLEVVSGTVGDVLRKAHVSLGKKDIVRPPITSTVRSGMHIFIRRAIPVTIQADGKSFRFESLANTVGGALAEAGVLIAGEDEVNPPLDSRLVPYQVIKVTRVRTETEIESSLIPFNTIWVPDDNLEIDHTRMEQKGIPGIKKSRYKVVYKDGKLVERVLEETWVEKKPVVEKLAYGRKIVLHHLTLPDGQKITYWRKIRMLATSYTAATSGKPRNHPLFGITRLGWKMRRGIVAVDPRVVNLGGRVYVPGYGFGDVADTGGRILGRRIDLGYDEDDLVYWYKWVDVYLLAPPPPKSRIPWVLPNWPKEH